MFMTSVVVKLCTLLHVNTSYHNSQERHVPSLSIHFSRPCATTRRSFHGNIVRLKHHGTLLGSQNFSRVDSNGLLCLYWWCIMSITYNGIKDCKNSRRFLEVIIPSVMLGEFSSAHIHVPILLYQLVLSQFNCL
jgi:hypothetical protein